MSVRQPVQLSLIGKDRTCYPVHEFVVHCSSYECLKVHNSNTEKFPDKTEGHVFIGWTLMFAQHMNIACNSQQKPDTDLGTLLKY